MPWSIRPPGAVRSCTVLKNWWMLKTCSAVPKLIVTSNVRSACTGQLRSTLAAPPLPPEVDRRQRGVAEEHAVEEAGHLEERARRRRLGDPVQLEEAALARVRVGDRPVDVEPELLQWNVAVPAALAALEHVRRLRQQAG